MISYNYTLKSRFQEALEDAEHAIKLDPKYEKAYIRKTSALESLKLKKAVNIDDIECPVLNSYRAGLKSIPGSKLLHDAIKISYPWMTDKDLNTLCSGSSSSSSSPIFSSTDLTGVRSSTSYSSSTVNSSTFSSSSSSVSTVNTTNTTGKKKKMSGSTRAQRESCEIVDIRGATGVHELRVNGIYVPTEEIVGGWPVYKKRMEEDDMLDDDSVDEDDNMVLEYQSGE